MAATDVQLVLKFIGSVSGNSSHQVRHFIACRFRNLDKVLRFRSGIATTARSSHIQMSMASLATTKGLSCLRSSVSVPLSEKLIRATANRGTVESSGGGLRLEPQCSNLYVEPTGSAARYSSDRIAVPESTATARHYIHLREDDIVNFANNGVKFRVMFTPVEPPADNAALPQNETTSATPELPEQDEVQVKSSNAEDDRGEATDSDEEQDLDDGVPAQTPVTAITPATSLPSAGLPTITETPNTKKHVAASVSETDAGDGEPFSTAQDELTTAAADMASDDELVDSPSSRTNRATTVMAPALQTPFEALGASAPGSGFRDIPVPQGTSNLDTDSPSIVPHAPSKIEADYTHFGMDGTAGADYAILGEDTEDEENFGGNVNADGDTGPSSDDGDEENDRRSEDLEVEVGSNEQQLQDNDVEGSEQPSETPQGSGKRKRTSELESDDVVKREGGVDEEIVVVTSKKRKTSHTSEVPASSASEPRSTRASKGRLTKPGRQISVEGSPASGSPIAALDTSDRISPQVIVPRASATPSSTATSPITGKIPKVLLSHDSGYRKSHSKWLKEQGSEIIDDVKTRRTHFVCVVNKDQLRTAKVLRSLALGKYVVMEAWLTDSKKSGYLLDPADYWHPQVGNKTVERRNLFRGMNLFFTTTLADSVYGAGWQDIVDLCNEAGASSVLKGRSSDYAAFSQSKDTICFGTNNSDADVGRLQSQFKVDVHSKALVSHTMISGELDLADEEFILPMGGSKKKKKA